MKKLAIVLFLAPVGLFGFFSFAKAENTDSLVYLSSEVLNQGDVLIIKVKNEPEIKEMSGRFYKSQISFFKLKDGKEWLAFVGIGAKTRPSKYNLTINLPLGKFKKTIEVKKSSFPTTKLLVTKKVADKGLTQEKIIKYISEENAVLAKALNFFTPGILFTSDFINPLKEIKSVGNFGNFRKAGKTSIQHLGIDLDAALGTPVFAANDGVVRFEGELKDFGKIMIIDHGLGIYSFYLHLDKFEAALGSIVKKGDIIGLTGDTGYSLAPHLHFSIKVNGASVDPLNFISLTEKEFPKE